MPEELYNLPHYYDIAFSWDIEPEVAFLEAIFMEHVPFPVERILEPACGTGRFLRTLPLHGYTVTGYDASPVMLDYARTALEDAGLARPVTLRQAEMQTASFDREFDAALNSINSIGYLLDDGDIVSHLRLTGQALKPGGVYVVHLSCAWDGRPDMDQNTWEMERDGVKVRTTWTIESEDRDARRSHHVCTMEIEEHGKRRVLVDRHTLRLWIYEELREFIARSGTFELKAIYDESPRHQSVQLDSHINGEMGNLYYVLSAL
ncbi:MAG: class I SAM-dependent methyltransferase [Candidatus Eisenbacteria bacterium]|nr:class I SAM-dependent methyltransferase [Candidatus Eisenbacteria bacterium]